MTRDEIFPDSPRVVYRKAPLQRVVCQFRFPPILRIDAEIPSAFQDRIRADFPLFERQTPIGAELQLPKQIIDALANQFGAVSYKFFRENKKSFVEITSGTFNYSTDEYVRWESFAQDVYSTLSAFEEIYSPSFYARIGIRYINSINRASLGLSGVPWRELLKPHIVGELENVNIERKISAVQKIIRVGNAQDTGGFLLQHGLGAAGPNENAAYVIDFDFYEEKKTELKNAKLVLDGLHSRSGLAWRWCITDRLHDALGPDVL